MKGGWSTRELAEIAGTTLKTVRHYHRIGLLDEPERTANGYKQYRFPHLIRLLRIRRLVDLGVSLPDIATMQESREGAEDIFRTLDAELAANIERQQRIRDDLAAIMRTRDAVELPPGFADMAGDLSENDRAFLMAHAQVFDPALLDALKGMYKTPTSEPGREFDALGEDASDEARQSLAERFAPELAPHLRHPRLVELAERVDAGTVEERTLSVLVHGAVSLYNPAQLDVLQRINKILKRKEHSEQID